MTTRSRWNARPVAHSIVVLLASAWLWSPGVALAEEIALPLGYNFNGMLQPGEAGQPDAPDGFRSISDRALIVDGGAMSFGSMTSPASGLSYEVVDVAGVLDILHIGNRNTVDSGNWAFEPVPNGNDIGVQPDWLADPDQTTVVDPVSPGIELDDTAAFGFLYQVSNGGGDFDVTLGFSDATSVTVTLNGPDWFGPFAGMPNPAGPGVDLQDNLGVDFTGAENVDSGAPGATLIVTEAVVDAASLLADLGFDVDGKVLTEITYGNRSNTIGGYAVLAATAIGRDPQILEIPTLGRFGFLLLVLLLAAAGGVMLGRRT